MKKISKKQYSYEYPRPALTVDSILLSDCEPRQVLLIQRKQAPFARRWAFPGGFVNEGEELLAAALRELREETGFEVPQLEQLYTAGHPGRDPRGWVVSVVFIGRVHPESQSAIAADDAAQAKWFPLQKLPKFAFDHAEIMQRAIAWLKFREG